VWRVLIKYKGANFMTIIATHSTQSVLPTLKPSKDIIRKETYRSVSLMNIDTNILKILANSSDKGLVSRTQKELKI
jgi:hypothetical protein